MKKFENTKIVTIQYHLEILVWSLKYLIEYTIKSFLYALDII